MYEGVSLKMIDKKKELENLENKYQEIRKLNSEISSMITNIKNDVEINREKKLLEENSKLEKKLKYIIEKLKIKEKELESMKISNTMLKEELKDTKRTKRAGEINRFQLLVSEKVNVELESKIIKKLSDFLVGTTRKIGQLEKELMDDFSKEATELNQELKNLNEKIRIFVTESKEKVNNKKESLLGESSMFHNKIEEEIANKEEGFLFEKEKKKFIFEKFIGLKGFNFLGIISIFLGVFLVFRTQFVKFLANDYVKSASSYLLGIIFLFVGEKFYQKNKKHFSVGLIGGGVGILYLTTLLSTLYLGLFPMMTGLLISVILTGLVIVLSLRYDSQIIGILALIGGYLPYGAYILVNRTNVQIYYLIAYSLILQGIILGISWKKDWMNSKITGFVIGTFNMAGLVYYLNNKINDKWGAFFYIVVFTTAYSFIFLNSHKKEKREVIVIDYVLLILNLIVKFSLIISLIDATTPSWVRTALVGGVGLIYGFFGDRLKENRISKIFYIVALGCFILIIPLIVPGRYVVLAWGLETAFLYLLYKKYNSTELKYGTIAIYIVSLISNFVIREEKYFIVYLQDLMIIYFSFVVYFLLKKKSYRKNLQIFNTVFKYSIFLYSMIFISDIIIKIGEKIKFIEYMDSSLASVLAVMFILRKVTYKVRELIDGFSLKFLVIMEIISLLAINVYNFFWYQMYEAGTLGYYISMLTLVFANIYLFMSSRNDIYMAIFKKEEKKPLWILGESVYIILISGLIMGHSFEFKGTGLALNIIGLLICGYLVWKGFKVPNRDIRRIGLGIGIFFVIKSFVLDFPVFDNSYKLVAYFIMGAILIGTSYIYQTALKKLEQETREEVKETDNPEIKKEEAGKEKENETGSDGERYEEN